MSSTCPLRTPQNRSNKLVKLLFDEGAIEDRALLRKTRENTNPPRIYALPKIHKNDTPLRPIVDYTDSPGSELAIFLKMINFVANSFNQQIQKWKFIIHLFFITECYRIKLVN